MRIGCHPHVTYAYGTRFASAPEHLICALAACAHAASAASHTEIDDSLLEVAYAAIGKGDLELWDEPLQREHLAVDRLDAWDDVENLPTARELGAHRADDGGVVAHHHLRDDR
eukprot:6179851-Pleurochrysis_carterae.AAC.2